MRRPAATDSAGGYGGSRTPSIESDFFFDEVVVAVGSVAESRLERVKM